MARRGSRAGHRWRIRPGLALATILLTSGCAPEISVETNGPTAGWSVYGGDAGGTRYSPLTQITRDNVSHLEVAWIFHTGESHEGSNGTINTSFQATPILADGLLYFCSPLNRVFAIDAETGQQRWVYQPDIAEDPLGWTRTCRGVASWLDPETRAGSPCRRRIYMGTVDAQLVALDAESGAPCRDFGEGGIVDLRTGLGSLFPGEYRVTSPPTLIGDRVVVGAMVADGQRIDAAGGVVRGFDARSGELRWSWDPVPPDEDRTNESAPIGPYRAGTPNAWSIFSADPERDLVFVPTGNASPDFYGGLRRGLDYYSSSVVALRGETGELVWHFQTVHRDVWDYDVASQPSLIDIWHGGAVRPAVAQATKMGHLFLLDRVSGVPLFPVEERPVPGSDVDGEERSKTQPFPTHPPPLHPPSFSAEDAFGLTPWDRAACRKRIASLRHEGIFTPPSLRGSIQYPGVSGGANWGGMAFDPERRIAVVNQSRIANVMTLVPRESAASVKPNPPLRSLFPQRGAPYALQQEVLVSPLGIPCNPPPWGTLTGVDLDSGRVLWEVPLGTTRDRAPFPFWFDWGMPNLGGAIATGSGLVFIGATLDNYLRAFDIDNGREVWKARLPAGGQATPMTYRVAESSRQFVVIAAGGHGGMGTTPGDSLVAFALP